MHHKLIRGGLGFPEGPKIKKRSKLGGFGYESDHDDDDESNMTNVGCDHIPLTPGLSHIVRLELGSDPTVFGTERKVSDVDGDESSTSSAEEFKSPSSLKDDAPAEIRPLYKEEPIISIESRASSNLLTLQRADSPRFLYNTKRSKDVLQLQLAMEKQTEFDGQCRDMDHRLHCIHKPNSTPVSRKRSRSLSPVPQVIDLSSPEEPPAKRKSPPNVAVAVAAAAAAIAGADVARADVDSDVATPTSTPARASPILLKSTFVRRPHKNKRMPKPSSKASAAPAKAPSPVPAPAKKPAPKKQTSDEDDEENRFKRFQNTQWHEKFGELLQFRKENGHCQVPHTWPPNPQLARWVKRQRYQFKLRCEGKMSTMTEDRVQLLDEVGFVWDSHAAAWQEKYEELKDYVKTYKTFNMGNSYSTHPQLATWVKCQRRQYKLLMMGQESNMTPERKELLEKLGFLWGVRNTSSPK